MKYLFSFIFMMSLSLYGHSQTTEDSVKATINKLFVAMKNADSAAVANLFSSTAVMNSIAENKEAIVNVRLELANNFASVIAKLNKGDADERITYSAIHIDGTLASVWTPYQFYYKGNFSHCGVNSFQLVRINGEWKIQYIIDTRRKVGCL